MDENFRPKKNLILNEKRTHIFGRNLEVIAIVIPDQWPRIRKRIQAQPLRRILFGYSRMKGAKRGGKGNTY